MFCHLLHVSEAALRLLPFPPSQGRVNSRKVVYFLGACFAMLPPVLVDWVMIAMSVRLMSRMDHSDAAPRKVAKRQCADRRQPTRRRRCMVHTRQKPHQSNASTGKQRRHNEPKPQLSGPPGGLITQHRSAPPILTGCLPNLTNLVTVR